MKTTFKYLFLVIVLVFGLSSCQNNNREVKFGVIAPLTGPGARYGDAMKDGIDLAIEEINSQGGINGHKVEAIYQDDKFSQKDAISAFNYLKDIENVPVIFGPAASGISMTLAPLADSNKIVLFSSISTSDDLKNAGDYFFRNISANALEAKSLANFLMNSLKIKRVGVFYENNEYGQNMNTVFKEHFKNGTIVFDLPYEFKQADFKSSIASIKKLKFDAIVIPGTTWGIAMLVRQLREFNIDCPILTGDGGYGDEIKTIAGKAANGLYCTLPSIKDTLTNDYVSFKNKFLKSYQKLPDVYSALSYDAVMMVYDGIKNEKISDINGELIRKKLMSTTYFGLGGEYKFDAHGDVDKPFFIFQYENGVYKQIN